MGFMQEAQLRRVALYKMVQLVGQHSSRPEVLKHGTMDDWAKRLAVAYKQEQEPTKRFKLLLAATGLAAYEAAWLLEVPDTGEVIVDLETYREWKRQDSDYVKRMNR